ncbi:uncharacterized protein LOC143460763 isoform X2 [Clavelina lepadiformis]|uniref:uncharacterized protein LOC143460763 isoform X2 n=1 Tax=Clavelina lepadiformis TaxID=159417 RepID=UPI004042601F
MCKTEKSMAYCPFCQIPLKFLRKQIVNLHLEVCFRKKPSGTECPKGEGCDSSMICHYERYSHKILAKKRSNCSNLNQSLNNSSTIPTIVLDDPTVESGSSLDDFETVSPTQSMKGYSPIQKKNTKRKISSKFSTSTSPKRKLRSAFKEKTSCLLRGDARGLSNSPLNVNCSDSSETVSKTKLQHKDEKRRKKKKSTNLSQKTKTSAAHQDKKSSKSDVAITKVDLWLCNSVSSNSDVEKRNEADETESQRFLSNSSCMKNTFTSKVGNDSLPTDDSLNWQAPSPKGPGFVPKCPPPMADESLDSQSDALSSNTCDASVTIDDNSFNATSSQLNRANDSRQPFPKKENISDSNNNFGKNNVTSNLNAQTTSSLANNLRNPINKSPSKQGDIRCMLFGMKSEPNRQPDHLPELGSNGKKRQCPFYKKINGTDIAVDAFSYGIIPGIKFYFLSHFHYDHYMGLTKKFSEDIYCSHVTGNLVQLKLKLPENLIKRLPMNKEVAVGNVKVTLLEANHCPGAVLFLFRLKNGQTMLHTGDFRANQEIQNHKILKETPINTLYLDTTYLDSNYNFPPQSEVIEFTSNEVYSILADIPKTLIVTGTYCIGKEKIFMGIARKLNNKVCVTRDKFNVLKCLENVEINSVITLDPNATNIHVLPMKQLSFNSLFTYLQKFQEKYDQIIAIKPTGWTHNGNATDLKNLRPTQTGRVTLYGVPYSEHSSFTELKEFVQTLKPFKIIPTVNVARADQRKMMNDYLNKWKQK